MMNFIEAILENHPSLKPAYNKESQYWLKNYQDEDKESLKEHEWWKEYIEEPKNINDIPIATKYRILWGTIRELIKNFGKNKELLISIFSTAENYINLEGEQSEEIEVLFFETILNYLSWHPDMMEKVIPLLGPKSQILCERNNAFWEQLANESEKRLE